MEKERFKRRINVGAYQTKVKVGHPVNTPNGRTQKGVDFDDAQKQALSSGFPETSFSLELPGEQSSYKDLVVKKQLGPQIRSWTFRVTSVVMILTILAGGLLFTESYLNIHKTLEGNAKTVAALQSNVNPDQMKGEEDGRVNLLVMGRGGGDKASENVTDTMMLVSIDALDDTAVVISLPKDLWVQVPNQPAMKLSQVWENGEYNYQNKDVYGSTDPSTVQAADQQVDQAVEQLTGVPVSYNIIGNFAALEQIVNSVGGITLDIPKEIYDPTLARANGGTGVIAQPGWRTFTGQQALNYVRSKATTSESARESRQRAMLTALKQKVETLGLVSSSEDISQLISSLGANVQSDLSIGDASQLYNLAKGIEPSSVTSVGLADQSTNLLTKQYVDGQSVEVPLAGMFNYTAIQGYVRSELPDPFIAKENAPILIVNGTTNTTIAASVESELQSFGYNIVGTANAPTSNYSQTEVVNLVGNKDKYTNHFLDERFDTNSRSSLPDNSIQTNGAAFVIIIGNNETVNSQT